MSRGGATVPDGGETCAACRAGTLGVGGFDRAVEVLASVETLMSCGCGGYATQGVHRCARCGRHFLASFEDHWPPSSADSHVFEIDRAEAEAIVAGLARCPEPESRSCRCPAHQEAELLHRRTRGTRRYFDALEQAWDP
jgi:hypothetical protein